MLEMFPNTDFNYSNNDAINSVIYLQSLQDIQGMTMAITISIRNAGKCSQLTLGLYNETIKHFTRLFLYFFNLLFFKFHVFSIDGKRSPHSD